MSPKYLRLFFSSLPMLALSGCVIVGYDYEEPELSVPDAWEQALTDDLESPESSLQTWWTVFNDPLMTEFITLTHLNNLDLRVAIARIEQARFERGIATGELFPDIDGTGALDISRSSEGLSPALPPGQGRQDEFVDLGLTNRWELDFWGRVRRGIESSIASLEATVEDYRDAQVLLYAETAIAYIDYRTSEERVDLARQNVETQRETLSLVQDRFDAGLVPRLDVTQAEQNLAQTESAIPLLEDERDRSVHRLAALNGAYPKDTWPLLADAGTIPEASGSAPVLLPADLIRQRPDIRQAERFLAAQTAQVGVAEGELYPVFTFNGSIAFQATTGSFNSVFTRGNLGWSFGPGFSWNLFDFGRVRNTVRVAESLTEQALYNYENTVILAAEEVENALSGYRREIERREALNRSVTAAKETVNLVSDLYREGIVDFQNVLDAQRTLFEQEDELAASRGTVARNLVLIFQSMGGGWSPSGVEYVDPNLISFNTSGKEDS